MRYISSGRKCAFTLTEMLFVLSILGVITLAGGRLFVSGIKTAHTAAQAQNRAATFDSAIAVLRRDIWSAHQISSSGDHVELIPVSGQPPVTWTSQSDSLVRHIKGQRDQLWPIGAKASFAAEDSGVNIEIAPSKGAAGTQLHLVNELQLLRRIP